MSVFSSVQERCKKRCKTFPCSVWQIHQEKIFWFLFILVHSVDCFGSYGNWIILYVYGSFYKANELCFQLPAQIFHAEFMLHLLKKNGRISLPETNWSAREQMTFKNSSISFLSFCRYGYLSDELIFFLKWKCPISTFLLGWQQIVSQMYRFLGSFSPSGIGGWENISTVIENLSGR